MSNLLVTGAAGFIGSNFLHYWAQNHPDHKLFALDALTYAGNRSSIQDLEDKKQALFIHGDICDESLVADLLRRHQIDTIVHFAAESHVDRSIHGPESFIETNVIGTHALLKAAKLVWLDEGKRKQHRFHHISTDEVYGSLGHEDPPFHERTPYAPNSPYSASKAASDHLVRAYHHTYGLQTTTSNCSNNYGPYQFPEKLIPLFILNILQGKQLPIYGDGQNIRDWLYVEDHCRAIDAILDRGQIGDVYNIGGNAEYTNLQLIDLLCTTMDHLFETDRSLAMRFPQAPMARNDSSLSLKTFVEDRAGHDRRYAIDTGKITSELGYRPLYGFTEGLQKTVSWYLQNESWWQMIKSGQYRQWIDQNYGT